MLDSCCILELIEHELGFSRVVHGRRQEYVNNRSQKYIVGRENEIVYKSMGSKIAEFLLTPNTTDAQMTEVLGIVVEIKSIMKHFNLNNFSPLPKYRSGNRVLSEYSHHNKEMQSRDDRIKF